jgi:hypothetical protein
MRRSRHSARRFLSLNRRSWRNGGGVIVTGRVKMAGSMMKRLGPLRGARRRRVGGRWRPSLCQSYRRSRVGEVV